MPELASEAMIREALADYPLRSPRVVRLLEASYRNENYVVEDKLGARFVLRRCRRNPSEARISFQVRFQDDLQGLGFPTSTIVRTRSGDALVTAASGIWTVTTFVDGADLDYGNLDEIAEAGRRLAQFHMMTQAIDLQDVAVGANQDMPRWWTHGEDELAAIERVLAGQGVDDELRYFRRQWADLIWGVGLSVVQSLPTGWVHGDFGGRNMIFMAGEMRGLVDFDETHRGPFLEDVAKAVVRLSRVERTVLSMRPEAGRLFLQSYETIRPLIDDERRAMVAFGVLSNLPRAGYFEMMRRDDDDWVGYARHSREMMELFRRELERFQSLGVFERA